MVVSINSRVEEASKIYDHLSESESPKEQFFLKQDIINQQESIRKLILNVLKVCERESSFIPQYTEDILNMDIFKNILERVSMENWSNQEDYISFSQYFGELKNNYLKRITPPEKYLTSLVNELS